MGVTSVRRCFGAVATATDCRRRRGEARQRVFDKRRGRFLDFSFFGVLGKGWHPAWRVFVLACVAAGIAGCIPRRAPGTVEDSLTSGRILVVCTPELLGILQHERAAFDSLYPGATIDLRQGDSSEAIRALFAAECDLAVISRELDPIERGAAVRGGLELEGFRFARDGVALVVHPDNPVENAALDEVGGIFRGSLTRWEALGGRNGSIRPVIQDPGSDIMAFFTARVLRHEPIQAPVVSQPSDSAVAGYVRGHPDAVGIVSMAWAERGVKPLRLATLKGLSYRRPDAEAVYEGEYALSRDMNLYVRLRGPALANGFITFITSRDGQAIVRDGGLVPTAVPVRFVRRSPMVGSHR